MLKPNIRIRVCLYVLFFLLSKLVYHTEMQLWLWPAPSDVLKSTRYDIQDLLALFSVLLLLIPTAASTWRAAIQVRSFPRNSRSVLEHANEGVFSLWYMMTMSLWQNVAGNQVLTVMDHQPIKTKSLLVCLSWNELKPRVAAREVWLWSHNTMFRRGCKL